MCKSKLGRIRYLALAYSSVAVALLAILLSSQKASAQNCSVTIADGPGVPDERTVHLGDTIHFYIHLNADDTVCFLNGGTNWVIMPDNTVHQILGPYTKAACNTVGSAFTRDCPAGSTGNSGIGCGGDIPTENGPISGAPRFKYGPIQPADVGRSLQQFATPRGSVFTAQLGLPLAGQVWIGAITDAGTTDCSDPTVHDKASGQGIAHVSIVTPNISVTKFCVTNCPPNNSAVYGTDIHFGGVICNTGDISLTNVSVSDNIAGATISYATTTTLGNPFPATGGGRLATNDCVTYAGSFSPSGNGCGPYPDTVVACGTDQSSIPKTVCATNSATCTVCTSPCLSITKDCSPKTTTASPTSPVTITFSGSVSNCGNVPLTNIVVTDSVDGGAPTTVTNIARLEPHTSAPYSSSFTETGCVTHVDKVHATGANLCGGALVQSNDAFCTNVINCPPCVGITKEVACFLGTNSQGDICDGFRKFAIGVQGTHANGAVQKPAFCYRITITNCADITLTNVTVSDDTIAGVDASDFMCIVNGTLAPHASCSAHFAVQEDTTDTIGTFRTNTATISGQSALTGQTVTALDTAETEVIPAKLVCTKYYTIDGGPLTNNVTLSDAIAHAIQYFVAITNTGLANLLDLTITDEGACNSVVPLRSLDAGTGTVVFVCTNSFSCGTARGVQDTITVVANAFSTSTTTQICAHDITGTNITASTECSATLSCVTPAICRVTGGGRQDLNDGGEVCPADALYVTHGGQVGAPVGNKVCTVTLDNIIGNPCIHGRWTHVRHNKAGGGEGNFHARYFDTLDCACLGTNLDSNCHWNAGTVTDGQCNPGDRLSGPEPRRAPANKIAFTGVGDWQCEKGGREPRTVLFRVDIEDRGEPGNDHTLDLGKKPGRTPDRYRIRIWVLTEAELARLRNGSDGLLDFRNCISACHGIDYLDGVCGPNTCNGDTCTGGSTGTITFPGGCPVRSPNIDDGGELLHGNHQIHPQIKDCP